MVLYGYAPGVRLNFVTWLVDRLRQGVRVSIVDDQFGTPTLADDLARSLLILYQKDGRGLYHTAGSECLSRYAFALSVADAFGLDASLIGKTTTADLNQTARRPLRSGLKIDKVRREMGVDFSSASQGLHIMKKQMGGDESTITETE
jgi:dTDP-4-dehydrorhamnose reductase